MKREDGLDSSQTVYDLIVVGSGAAGLCAAITAQKQGLHVLLLEKEGTLGGTTAVSGGWAWIPCNPVAMRAGVSDSAEEARRYLQHEAGERYSEAHVSAFLGAGTRVVDFLERETQVRFLASPSFPDYHSEATGAKLGRSIVTEPYDGRKLGPWLSRLRRPLRQTTLFGMNIGSGTELTHFFRATRSLTSALFVTRRMMAHFWDLLRYGRGTRLANGNALVGRFLRSAVDAGVDIRVSTPVHELLVESGRVMGVVVESSGRRETLRTRAGVVLACGGFSNDTSLGQEFFPHISTGQAYHTPVPACVNGDGIRLGRAAGGVIERRVSNSAAWMPVSLVPMNDASTAAFPHVIDRAKPGMIAVTRGGVRFVNEANSYHDFGQAMLSVTRGQSDRHVFLICDHRAIRRYGLGFVKPFPFLLGKHLRSGYLMRGATLIDLARTAGIDEAAFERTVREFNEDARSENDRRFGKGSTRYNRFQGDALHTPNPCVAPLETGPFYAVRIVLGDHGTFVGLKADPSARVLDESDQVIPGLFVAGNDMASIMGGAYPGAGINIGPAMAFGYIAALTAASDLQIQCE